MQRYLLKSVVQSLLLLLGVLILVFFMVRITGDPASLMVPREASQAQVEAFRDAMGFNRPLSVQFADFVWGAVRGDFGNSLHYRLPAMDIIIQRLPATLELATAALLFAVVIAIPWALWAASIRAAR
jgi:ABC-type dipeptide/oligopeptide/nickel transport system permease component